MECEVWRYGGNFRGREEAEIGKHLVGCADLGTPCGGFRQMKLSTLHIFHVAAELY